MTMLPDAGASFTVARHSRFISDILSCLLKLYHVVNRREKTRMDEFSRGFVFALMDCFHN